MKGRPVVVDKLTEEESEPEPMVGGLAEMGEGIGCAMINGGAVVVSPQIGNGLRKKLKRRR